jgi:hypothetical protein
MLTIAQFVFAPPRIRRRANTKTEYTHRTSFLNGEIAGEKGDNSVILGATVSTLIKDSQVINKKFAIFFFYNFICIALYT